jgi:hypothetical protein
LDKSPAKPLTDDKGMSEDSTAWLDEFFASFYKHQPVSATFIGIHTFDQHLPDFSKEGVEDLCNEMQSLLERKPQQNVNETPQYSDLLLANNFLETQLAEFQDIRFHLKNPAIYTGEAVMGIMSLFMRNFAPLSQRVNSAIGRMNAAPSFLEQGQMNVKLAPGEWIQRAMNECTGAAHFLGRGVNLLMSEFNITSKALREAANKALLAFKEYERYLSDQLLPAATNDYASGTPFFDLSIQKGHCVDLDAEEITEYGLKRFHQIQEQLVKDAGKLGSQDWPEVLGRLSNDHPSLTNYLESFGRLRNECERVSEAREFLTLPKSQVRYTFMPVFFRDAVPFLHFLSYWAPAAFGNLPIHDYFVTPIEESMPTEQQNRLLYLQNFSVLKLNYVVHHGSLGHHFQNYYAYRAKSRIGQVAAVDCARGIAMLCGGTMAEGWACYATDLMRGTGFYNELEEFAQLHSQLRQAARAVVDSNLHRGVFSFDQAVNFYSSQAGMTIAAAKSEVVRNSMFPGVGSMYLLGLDTIHKLRSRMTEKDGASFSLRSFHDRFLSYGSIPTSLIARSILGDELQLN